LEIDQYIPQDLHSTGKVTNISRKIPNFPEAIEKKMWDGTKTAARRLYRIWGDFKQPGLPRTNPCVASRHYTVHILGAGTFLRTGRKDSKYGFAEVVFFFFAYSTLFFWVEICF